MPKRAWVNRFSLFAGVSFVAIAFGVHRPASAVPAFAEQTGQPCASCHVGGFGPQLTPFGRAFKLGGYTLRVKPFNVPLSAMAVASYVHTRTAQEEPPTDHSKTNNNISFDQGSVFIAGGAGSHLGGFAQITYSGADRAWSWDNLDLRAVGTGKIADKDLVYGLSLNNNPTVEDAWNTLPAWGYPYTTSAYAPNPDISPLIDGTLAQSVIGMTGYAWFDSKYYVEAGGYRTPARGTLRWLGSDPDNPGDINGIAPYGRVAVQTGLGGGTVEAGAFVLKTALWPGRDRSSGLTDRYTDYGLDASWFKPLKSDTLTVNGRFTHEDQALNGSCALGMADGSIPDVPLSQCARNKLDEFRIDGSYYWHNTVGLTVSAFDTTGSVNPILYSGYKTMRPDSAGYQLQLDGTPFGGRKSPFGPRFNMRVGVQYTHYTPFNGSRFNYDFSGRNAPDNDTFRMFTWVAF